MLFPSLNYKFIAVEGNIGAGKTTLACKLAQWYNTRLVLEEFEENPFLPQFYKNPQAFAFNLETSFLIERHKQLKAEFTKGNHYRIADYYIGKTLLFAHANLNAHEYGLFNYLYQSLSADIQKPDLILFLQPATDELKNNINKRGRSYEKEIKQTYLEKIQAEYQRYLTSQTEIPVLVLNLKSAQYVNSLNDFEFLNALLKKDFKPGITSVEL
jgi:deoxyadenosine/deoxycytidine kinase